MYSEERRKFAVDLWFEMYGTISTDDFVAELGWPSRTALMRWVRADPRYDPDRAQYRSLPTISKLDLMRLLAGNRVCSRAWAAGSDGSTTLSSRGGVDVH